MNAAKIDLRSSTFWPNSMKTEAKITLGKADSRCHNVQEFKKKKALSNLEEDYWPENVAITRAKIKYSKDK